MEIKDILKHRRIELELTQLDVATAVGVSEATVSRWESGDIANMRRSRIAALARVLQISPSVIMGWNEDTSTQNTNSPSRPYEAGARDILDEIDIGFYQGFKELDEADKEVLRDMVRVMRERRTNKK
ncbi:MAG: helix-turn-helix domain-containing protein [Oscillospiraceae bacterium]|nr:helix-turn-helix domain-containing protein [Oscillospiraceae bacterium]